MTELGGRSSFSNRLFTLQCLCPTLCLALPEVLTLGTMWGLVLAQDKVIMTMMTVIAIVLLSWKCSLLTS